MERMWRMKLTLEYVDIKDIQFGDATKIENGVLYVNARELKNQILEDPFIKDVIIDICKPGESTRVIGIVDATEPRVKTDNGANWCGVLSSFSEFTGRGTTRCLKGMAVLMLDSNHLWPGGRFGDLDMSGPRAKLTPYSKLVNLTVECVKADNDAIDQWDFAASIRKACYGVGVYLARAALELTPDASETLDNETVDPKLPNVGYYQQVYAAQYQYENVAEPIYYGFAIPDSFPLCVHPQEVIDGAISWGHGYHQAETYAQQNHSIIMGLFRRHGKELNFKGMMIGTTNTDDHRRRLAAMMIANTMKDILRCDGVLLTKTFGGASHVCEGMAASECEKRGLVTVPMIQALNEHTNLSSEMLIDDRNLVSITQSGMYFERHQGAKMDKVIGHNPPGFPPDFYLVSMTTSPKAPQSNFGPNTGLSMCVFGYLSQIGNTYCRAMDF